MAGQKPIRLPTLNRLRVKNPNPKQENPCVRVMASLLACWASSGYNTAGCAIIEQQLRTCMDAKRPPPLPKSNINYHLSRFQKRFTGTTKSS
ncbi:hypothetical protein SAPIO_CDS7819 [Scedosporium apiospermum]|uniref:Small ribosomal subunit protein mS37 n=1 Tax=Pseudallescheria apiosperma TaxID=563466 RepID=A0A084G0R5_PSEDA|nr:uncharacterized protein SAPIO_CDS7819 [Scedosporium apiospermum]KEZ40927.1 hypothetical protein SAPIO_CDS7819 [Scedosporium apiospermum]